MKYELKEPLYAKIYKELLNKIMSGAFANGDKLPTEHEIMEQYFVSRTTAIRAIKELEKNKFIVRNRRSGTFVDIKTSVLEQQNIAVVMSFAENFNMDFFTGIQEQAEKDNCFTSFYLSQNSSKKERLLLSKLLNSNIHGMIFMPISLHSNIDVLSCFNVRNIPITFVDRQILGIKGSLVTSNNFGGMHELVTYLIRKGHRKIGYYLLHPDIVSTVSDRFNGFCRALTDSYIPIDGNYIIRINEDVRHKFSTLTNYDEYEREQVSKAVNKYLTMEEKPTAICCQNDMSAIIMIEEFTKRGIRVPQDIAVVGFDNIKQSATSPVPFTTVSQNFNAIGKHALISILKQISTGELTQDIIPSELIVRNIPSI